MTYATPLGTMLQMTLLPCGVLQTEVLAAIILQIAWIAPN